MSRQRTNKDELVDRHAIYGGFYSIPPDPDIHVDRALHPFTLEIYSFAIKGITSYSYTDLDLAMKETYGVDIRLFHLHSLVFTYTGVGLDDTGVRPLAVTLDVFDPRSRRAVLAQTTAQATGSNSVKVGYDYPVAFRQRVLDLNNSFEICQVTLTDTDGSVAAFGTGMSTLHVTGQWYHATTLVAQPGLSAAEHSQ